MINCPNYTQRARKHRQSSNSNSKKCDVLKKVCLNCKICIKTLPKLKKHGKIVTTDIVK